jgi:hypothetical protein
VRLALAIVLCAASVAAAPGKLVRVVSSDLDALPSRGPKDALVTIELFFRLRAETRWPEFKAIEHLQAQHPSRIRILYRLEKASNSSRLHYAALEAYAEGRFAEFVTELDKQTNTNLTDAQLLQVAASVGMNTEQLAEVLASPPAEFDRVLDDNLRRYHQRFHGNQAGVLVNGAFVSRSDINKPGELERVYATAKDQALDLLDRGVEPGELAEALEAQAAPNPLFITVPNGSPDDTVGEVPLQPMLATPALDLTGMPSYGPSDARQTIVVLCVPSTPTNTCRLALRAAKLAQEAYADRVRVVWAPFFDVTTRGDASELGLLADAALCAERVGASVADFTSPSSPGWDWLAATMDEVGRAHRRVSADRVLADVAPLLHVDEQAFSACRAHQAGTAIRWVVAATRAGVHASPSTVVGGRIYPAITDTNLLQQLVAAELEPGDCDGCLRLDTIVPAWRGEDRSAPP